MGQKLEKKRKQLKLGQEALADLAKSMEEQKKVNDGLRLEVEQLEKDASELQRKALEGNGEDVQDKTVAVRILSLLPAHEDLSEENRTKRSEVERLISELVAGSISRPSSSNLSAGPIGVHNASEVEDGMDLDEMERMLEQVLDEEAPDRGDDPEGAETRRKRRIKVATKLTEMCQVRKKGNKLTFDLSIMYVAVWIYWYPRG